MNRFTSVSDQSTRYAYNGRGSNNLTNQFRLAEIRELEREVDAAVHNLGLLVQG